VLELLASLVIAFGWFEADHEIVVPFGYNAVPGQNCTPIYMQYNESRTTAATNIDENEASLVKRCDSLDA
jgi:hypothetical protein